MTNLSVEDKHTKDLMKQALLELFEERRDLFYELFEELFEDVGLANAMREGENSSVVSEKEVMKALGLNLELEFRDSFLKDLNRIKELAVKKKIAAVITEAKSVPSLSAFRNIKKMEGSENYYRIRIGNHRIGVKLQGKTLIFLRCLHRKDIYRYFP